MLPDDGRRPEHEGAILVCILMYILKLIQFKKKNSAFVGVWIT